MQIKIKIIMKNNLYNKTWLHKKILIGKNRKNNKKNNSNKRMKFKLIIKKIKQWMIIKKRKKIRKSKIKF